MAGVAFTVVVDFTLLVVVAVVVVGCGGVVGELPSK